MIEMSKQKNLRNNRLSITENVYSITKCQEKNTNPNLTDHSAIAEIIIETFLFCDANGWIELGAFVISN